MTMTIFSIIPGLRAALESGGVVFALSECAC